MDADCRSALLPLFSMQFDESMDAANCSQLLHYVIYINDGDFKNEAVFCKTHETTTTTPDIIDIVHL